MTRCFNRTLEELKVNSEKKTRVEQISFNRTLEELKVLHGPNFPIERISFNRTLEELKKDIAPDIGTAPEVLIEP